MKILAPFSLYFDFGYSFGYSLRAAAPARIYLGDDSLNGLEGPGKDPCAAANG
jgi:hypothetical protein